MKLAIDSVDPKGYILWLSATDTENWATKPGAAWPCSRLAGKRLVVCCDSNGLCDFSIDGGRGNQDCPADELSAIVADHLPESARKLWPVYA